MYKKFLLRIAVFFLLALAVDQGIGLLGDYLLRNTKEDSRYLYDLLMKDEHSILFLGSSRCHAHYDTPYISDTLNLDAYNAGRDGNGVVLAHCILEKSLQRYRPKLVVLDVTPYVDMCSYQGEEDYSRFVSILKPFYRDETVAELMKKLCPEEWYKAHSGMVRYNTSLVPMMIYYLSDAGKDPYGFVATQGVIADDPPKGDKTGYVWDSEKLGLISKMMALSKSHQVPFCIAVSPEYDHYYSFPLDSLEALCKRYDVPLLNHYADTSIMMHKEWFRDPNHLNREGARVYSREIVRELKSIGLLPE